MKGRQAQASSERAKGSAPSREAMIDQLMESPLNVHRADGLEPSYFHDSTPCHEIALEHTHWLLHVLHAIPAGHGLSSSLCYD